MTRIYLVRHGETDYNNRGCYYGWTDCGLTQEGIKQSLALGKTFKNISYDVILSSDLKRAKETAHIMNCGSKEMIADDRLRELNFGHWEGKGYQEIQVLYQEHWKLWVDDWINAAPTEGESVIIMYERVRKYMDEVLSKYKEKSIVIVSHSGALRMIMTYLLQLPLDKIWCFSFEHGKYSLLEIHEGHSTIKGINNI